MRKKLTLVLLALLLVVLPAASRELIVLHTNDLHGQPLGPLAAEIDKIRARHRHVLLVDAGDLFSGTPVSQFYQGRAEIEAVLALNYDALAVGNHDFDYGRKILEESFRKGLPWLAANIFLKDGTHLMPPFLLKKIAGRRILLVGLTTTKTSTATLAENVAGLEFKNPAQALAAVLDDQQGNYDLCLVISHLGLAEDKLLAAKFGEKITAVIGGHSHIPLKEPLIINGCLIAQAGADAKFLGKITIPLQAGKPVLSKLLPLADVAPKEDIQAIYDRYAQSLEKEMENVLGWAGRDYTKKEVGTFIAEALAEWSGADAVLYNGGGIRGGLKAGPVTAEDIFLSEPFGNRLVVGEISGERLALIGEIKSRRQHDFFRGPAFIDPAKTYLLATSDFLAQGGSAYGLALKDKAGGSGKLVRDILTDYLLKNVLKQDLPPAASY